MKLVKCYVSSFGKLKDFSYDFSDGLNVFKEDNGWGKSTLATFIKAMFYGLDGNNKRSISDNERKKFKPWNSTETFGGFVQFEWGGNEFIIERYFGNKDSEDTIKLTDVKTGKNYNNVENLGKRIFEIDEEGFLSTTYFSQKDFEIKSNTSITAKFNAMCENGDSEVFDKAVQKIEQKAKTYKYSGDRGLIPDARREVFAVNDDIEKANRSLQTAGFLKEEVAKLEKKGKDLQKTAEELTGRVAVAGKAEALRDRKQRYNKLTGDRNVLRADKAVAENVLNGCFVSEVEISPYEQKARELDNLTEKIASINYDLSLLDQTEIPKEKKKNENHLSLFFGGFACLLLILSVIFFIQAGLSSILGWASIGTFIVSLILFLTLSKGKGKVDNEEPSPYLLIKETKREELGKCLRLKNEYESEVDEYISRFNILDVSDRITALSQIKKVASVYKKICDDLQLLESEIKVLEVDKTEFENADNNSENIAILEVELKRVQDEYTRNSIELANKRSTLKAHEDFASNLIDFENKKAEIAEKIARYEEEYSTLITTAKFLKTADENLKIRYRAPLQDSLNKYLSLISGKSNAKIDVDMTVTVQETGGERSTEYYSKGYQNLFEICKRFALTDVLFKKEKPFIILDDPFYNLDDKKVDLALELIDKLSNEYQIIYFVCHESRVLK